MTEQDASQKVATMTQRALSRQRPDFLVLAIAGGLTFVAGLVAIVRDLVRVLPNRDIPVTVDLAGVKNELLLNGAAGAEATEAVVRVSDLGPVPYTVVLVATLLPLVTMMVVAVSFTLLGGSFFRSEFFTRRNLVSINTAAAALGLGSVAIPSLRGTAASSALASIDAVRGQAVVMEVDAVMFLAGLLLAAVGYAFQRGARLQADTEGLV
jgi:hypothetical protein